MRTGDLTNGERILIRRRRQCESQRESADGHQVSLYRYRQWERDENDPPRVSIGALKPWEACFIMRRRSGATLAELAAAIGVSRWWLCQMEYGQVPADRLVDHWIA